MLTASESCGTQSVSYAVILKQASENAKKPKVSPGKRKENLNRDVLEEKQKAAETRRKVKTCTCIKKTLQYKPAVIL